MNTITHKGYTARIEFDERDNIVVGRVSACAIRSASTRKLSPNCVQTSKQRSNIIWRSAKNQASARKNQ